MKRDWILDLSVYVKKKVKSFAEIEGLTEIEINCLISTAESCKPGYIDYINNLLNSVVETIANKNKEEFNIVKSRFCEHYLS